MKKYITRPEWHEEYAHNRRAEVWYHRWASAYDLAERITGAGKVTQEDYDAAAKLLDSCQRYTLASARAWECDNDSRYSSAEWLKKRIAQLKNRRVKLQKSLARYGVCLDNYGLYCCVREIDKPGTDLYLLHWFE